MSEMNEAEVESSEGTPEEKPNRKRFIWWILGAILILLLLGGGGAYMGYQSGINERLAYQSTQVSSVAAEQFELGVKDIEAGRFEIARQRFQAIIQIDPGYPGLVEKLTQVELALSITITPTLEPTPTLTPTPDLRGAEELFNQARQYMADKNWQAALDTLDSLRRENIDYRPIDVDGMYYVSLRYRGVERIGEGSLEMGLYALSLTERFGPLDSQALGMRTWTRYYLTGASFWEVDWAQASYYFGEVYPYYPGLRDSSGQTAKDRYRIATLKWADKLVLAGDPCQAQTLYETVMALGMDPTVEPTLSSARDACQGPQVPEPPPAGETTPTPTLLPTVPVETPVETPIETPVPTNSDTQPTPGG